MGVDAQSNSNGMFVDDSGAMEAAQTLLKGFGAAASDDSGEIATMSPPQGEASL